MVYLIFLRSIAGFLQKTIILDLECKKMFYLVQFTLNYYMRTCPYTKQFSEKKILISSVWFNFRWPHVSHTCVKIGAKFLHLLSNRCNFVSSVRWKLQVRFQTFLKGTQIYNYARHCKIRTLICNIVLEESSKITGLYCRAGGRLFWFKFILTNTCHFLDVRPLMIKQT